MQSEAKQALAGQPLEFNDLLSVPQVAQGIDKNHWFCQEPPKFICSVVAPTGKIAHSENEHKFIFITNKNDDTGHTNTVLGQRVGKTLHVSQHYWSFIETTLVLS